MPAARNAKKSTAKKAKPAARKTAAKSAKKSAATKSTAKKSAAKSPAKKKVNRWSASVDTDSTHPQEGLFNKGAAEIARSLASKKVSPKGPSSGMRMLTFYINRAGHNLTASRRAELQKAKSLLSKRIASEKETSGTSRTK